MKKLLPITLTLALAAVGTHLLADDDNAITVKITKVSDTRARVTPEGPGGPAVVPITFDSGADWDAVKDAYSVSPETLARLKQKRAAISIGSDGTATFHGGK